MHYTHEEEDRVRAEIDAAKARRWSASAPSETACQPRSLDVATCSADFVQQNHDKLCALAATLKHLVEVIEAHEIESISCDRDGNEHCDCLRNAATKAKRLLPNVPDQQRALERTTKPNQ